MNARMIALERLERVDTNTGYGFPTSRSESINNDGNRLCQEHANGEKGCILAGGVGRRGGALAGCIERNDALLIFLVSAAFVLLLKIVVMMFGLCFSFRTYMLVVSVCVSCNKLIRVLL